MSKTELAAYIASLLTILDSQDKSAIGRSSWVAEEFDKTWALWKSTVEKENETRTIQQPIRRPEAGADQPLSEPRRSLTDRHD